MGDSLVHAAAGAMGGMIAMGITYPLISISTRAQVESKKNQQGGIRDAIRKILKEDGFTGLYDGLSSSLFGISVTNGVYYLFFEESRTIILRLKKKTVAPLTAMESVLASALAGAATSIIVNPIWVVNTLQTVRSSVEGEALLGGQKVVKKKLGFFETLIRLVKAEGLSALFNGLGPALILVSNPIIQYTVFEQLKNLLIARRALASKVKTASALPLSDLDFFLLGAFSKLLATGFTYPYLTVKSRMQAASKEGRSYTSSFDGLNKILKNEGVEGLYRGMKPKLIQSVLTAAFLFASKEKVYRMTKHLLEEASKASKVVKT